MTLKTPIIVIVNFHDERDNINPPQPVRFHEQPGSRWPAGASRPGRAAVAPAFARSALAYAGAVEYDRALRNVPDDGRADRRLAAEAAIAPPSSGGERAAKLAVIESGWLGDTDHRVRCAVDALGRWLRGRAFGDRAWLNRARPVARRVDGAIETWLGDLLACAGSLCWQWRL